MRPNRGEINIPVVRFAVVYIQILIINIFDASGVQMLKKFFFFLFDNGTRDFWKIHLKRRPNLYCV